MKNGLSVSPSEALELTNRGMSISTLNAQNTQSFPSDAPNDWDVPFEFQRGVDALADGYQMQQAGHAKLREGIRRARRQQEFEDSLQTSTPSEGGE